MNQKKVFNVVYVTSNHGTGEGMTSAPDCQLVYTGTQVSCSPATIRRDAMAMPNLMCRTMTVRTAGNRLVFNRDFADMSKSVAVYDLSGKLVSMKTVRKNAVDLRKDLGVAGGVYIVKVKVVR
jgi:hypothetical protein